MATLILTILGSGTSTGVPMIHCKCKVCRSRDPKDNRTRCSAWLQVGGKSFLLDTSIDLRQQAMRAKIDRIDAVLYTHPHADHVFGIDELRSFNFKQREIIPLFGNEWTEKVLFSQFPYIFNPDPHPRGGGIPLVKFQRINEGLQNLCGIPIEPIGVPHGTGESFGYRIDSLAYMTDCEKIPDNAAERLKNLEVLIINCVRIAAHDTHLNLSAALEAIERIKPKKAYLTHLNHDFKYSQWKKKLPKGVALAYDGLKIRTSMGA